LPAKRPVSPAPDPAASSLASQLLHRQQVPLQTIHAPLIGVGLPAKGPVSPAPYPAASSLASQLLNRQQAPFQTIHTHPRRSRLAGERAREPCARSAGPYAGRRCTLIAGGGIRGAAAPSRPVPVRLQEPAAPATPPVVGKSGRSAPRGSYPQAFSSAG